jgi:hypothetical protein
LREYEEEREILVRTNLIERIANHLLSTTIENIIRGHCEIGEGIKLIGIQNYNEWCIKVEVILRTKRLWLSVENKEALVSFSTTIVNCLDRKFFVPRSI